MHTANLLEVLEVACKKLTPKNLGGVKVRADTNFVDLLDSNPWLKSTRLVVKPDMLFGKRGKHDLVRLQQDLGLINAATMMCAISLLGDLHV